MTFAGEYKFSDKLEIQGLAWNIQANMILCAEIRFISMFVFVVLFQISRGLLL
jgi:hypothetical protein